MQPMTSSNPDKKRALEALKAASGGRKITNLKFSKYEDEIRVKGDCFARSSNRRGWLFLGNFEASLPPKEETKP